MLNGVKTYLAAGIPSMFGFFGFQSFNQTNVKGGIHYPCPDEKARWGHAIVAAGYDDSIKIKNTKCNKETTGALLIRNSWARLGATAVTAGCSRSPGLCRFTKKEVSEWQK